MLASQPDSCADAEKAQNIGVDENFHSDSGVESNSGRSRVQSTIQHDDGLPLFSAQPNNDDHPTARHRSSTLTTLASIPVTVKESIARVLAHRPSVNWSGLVPSGKMGWKMATCIMVAETISLGILSLAAAVSLLGFVSGVVLIISAGIVTTCNGKIMHLYRMRVGIEATRDYPTAVENIWGKPGRWMAEVLQMVFLIFLMAAHVLVFNNMVTALNRNVPSCTVSVTIIAAIIMGTTTLPRAFKTCSIFSFFSCISIVFATFTVIIDLSIHRPKVVALQNFTSLDHGFTRYTQVILVISNVVVSYTGHFAYFNIMNEMRDPDKDFPKALYVTNGITIVMYTIAGAAIYGLAGESVKSPALSSASVSGRGIAYGFAIPTIIMAAVIAGLVACKRIYTLAAGRCPEIEENSKSFKAVAIWTPIVIILWLLAWIIANIIPLFSALLAVIGALCGTWICLGWPAAFWLWSLRRSYGGPRWKSTLLSTGAFVILFVCILLSFLGMYGSISEIMFQIGRGGVDGWASFTCAPPPGGI